MADDPEPEPPRPQVALVTGASHGIGAGIVRRLIDDGLTVVIGVETEVIAGDVRSEWASEGVDADVVAADLRDRDACRALVDGCVDRYGRIDVLVNNAAVTGVAARSAFLESDDASFEALMDVNVNAVFRCSQQAARRMVAQGGGLIVNIGSVAGFAAQYRAMAYTTSKSAVLGMTRAIALELGASGVRSMYIAPGDIDNGRPVRPEDAPEPNPWARATPLGRRGTPADVAAVVSFLCTPDAQFVSGTSWNVDGGWLAY